MSNFICAFCENSETEVILFCKTCGKLSPTSPQSYFDLLGLAEDFLLCPQNLEKKYLAQQRLLHPDQFVLKSEEERHYAEEHTMRLNEAYKILKSPSLRGHYLLTLKKGAGLTQKQVQDPIFLMEMMEQREHIDSLMTEEEIEQASHAVTGRLHVLEKDIGEVFCKEDFQKASQLLNQFQYIVQLYKTLQAKKS